MPQYGQQRPPAAAPGRKQQAQQPAQNPYFERQQQEYGYDTGVGLQGGYAQQGYDTGGYPSQGYASPGYDTAAGYQAQGP